MTIPLRLLQVLILASPVLLLWHGRGAVDVVAIAGVLTLALAVWAVRPGKASHAGAVLAKLAPIAALPAVWMLLQLLPLPGGVLANPIWDTASAAHGERLGARITVDVWATLAALTHYLAALCLLVAAAAVAVDRQRAETLLDTLAAAGTLVAAFALVHWLGFLPGLSALGPLDGPAVARLGAALGAVFSACATVRAYERYETRGSAPERAHVFLRLAAAWLVCAVICCAAVGLASADTELLALGAGIALVPGIIVVRRLGFEMWGMGAIYAVFAVLAVALALRSPALWTSRGDAPAAGAGSLTERMLGDVSWMGGGAGTFSVLAPVYRTAEDGQSLAPETAAAGIAVETGRVFLAIVLFCGLGAVLLLLVGALRRGRDSFYPLAGASLMAVLLLGSFVNAGLFGPSVLVLAASGLGLALAQRLTRTSA